MVEICAYYTCMTTMLNQLEGQLAICDKEYSNFICWTTHGIYVKRITRDPAYFDTIKLLLDKFFSDVLLPCLLKGSVIDYDRVAPASATQTAVSIIKINLERDQKYCWCDAKESGKVVETKLIINITSYNQFSYQDQLINYIILNY